MGKNQFLILEPYPSNTSEARYQMREPRPPTKHRYIAPRPGLPLQNHGILQDAFWRLSLVCTRSVPDPGDCRAPRPFYEKQQLLGSWTKPISRISVSSIGTVLDFLGFIGRRHDYPNHFIGHSAALENSVKEANHWFF